MNGYISIFIMSFILIVISIINESDHKYIFNSSPSVCEYFFIYIIRFFHYFVYIWSSFYLLFFGIGKQYDMYLYLILIFCIELGWYIFDSCWMSYFELLHYNINLENIKTTFHPTFYSIYSDNTSTMMSISGILYILTVSILLYYLKIPLLYKGIYYVVFWGLLIDSIMKSKVKDQYYSSEGEDCNNQLVALKNIYIHGFSKICGMCQKNA